MRFLLCFCFLAACNTPTFAFRDAPVQRVQVAKSTFDVRIMGNQAQAIRINREYAPNWRFTAARFYQAFRIASNCDVVARSMTGDQVVMEARLDCDGTAPPISPHMGTSDIECDPVRGIGTRRIVTLNCKVLGVVATPEKRSTGLN